MHATETDTLIGNHSDIYNLGKRPERKNWWKRIKKRFKDETHVHYKGFARSKDHGETMQLTRSQIELAERAKWEVKSCEQDASFIPTLAICLWLGTQGVLAWILIDFVFFATQARRILFLVFTVFAFIQPRDKRFFTWKSFVMQCSIYVIIVVAIFLRAITVFVLAVSIAMPLRFPSVGLRLGEWIALQSQKYFALKTTIEDPEQIAEISRSQRSLVFALEPHDVLAYGCFAFHPALKVLPEGRARDSMHCLVSSAMLNAPIVRNISAWCLCSPVEKSYFRSYLSDGSSVVFCPGGVQEVLLMDPKNEPEKLVVFLKERKGFVKLALENGSALVPSFCFGLDESYAYFLPRGEFINNLSRAVGFIPIFVLGRFYIPFGIPRPNKIHVVIGKAIECPKLGKNISQRDIDEYHQLFLNELQKLFDRHKQYEELYESRELKIS